MTNEEEKKFECIEKMVEFNKCKNQIPYKAFGIIFLIYDKNNSQAKYKKTEIANPDMLVKGIKRLYEEWYKGYKIIDIDIDGEDRYYSGNGNDIYIKIMKEETLENGTKEETEFVEIPAKNLNYYMIVNTESKALKEELKEREKQVEDQYKTIVSFLEQLDNQNAILDILKPYLEVSQDEYYYYVKLAHDYIITKEQYETLKEWLEND